MIANPIFFLGPNATTFISPAECFPTRVRSTAHGLSAAAGKLGAVIAQVAFAPMVKRGGNPNNPNPWLHGVMQIFSLFMFCGLLTTFLVPETKQLTLEELSGESANSPQYELQFRSNFFRLPGGGQAPVGAGDPVSVTTGAVPVDTRQGSGDSRSNWRFGRFGSKREPTDAEAAPAVSPPVVSPPVVSPPTVPPPAQTGPEMRTVNNYSYMH